MGEIFHTNIEADTIANTEFRKIIFTGSHQQLVLMSLKPQEDIPLEIHSDVDQFIRIEKGTGVVYIGPHAEKSHILADGTAIIIPANTYHRIVNTSETEDLKLYTIYAPPEHPVGEHISGGNDDYRRYQKYKQKYLLAKSFL